MGESPFIKVEATQFTEIGYHGKDVETIVTELTGLTMRKYRENFDGITHILAEDMGYVVDLLILDFLVGKDNLSEEQRKEKFGNLRKGLYDDFQVTIELPRDFDETKFQTINDYLEALTQLEPPFQRSLDKQTVKVKKARQVLLDFFLVKMHFRIDIKQFVIDKIENEAIVFIDEIDKIVHNKNFSNSGKSPSSEGVQRDLLPLIEGTTITTKFGDVNTNHILFICSGAFSSSKPSDLMPELLGRLPLQISLKALTKKDFEKILTGVEYNLLHQHKELLKTEGISVDFDAEAVLRICELSEEMNLSTQNIGARRLHSVLEKVVEDISYQGKDSPEKQVLITAQYVDKMMLNYREKNDYTKYLL